MNAPILWIIRIVSKSLKAEVSAAIAIIRLKKKIKEKLAQCLVSLRQI